VRTFSETAALVLTLISHRLCVLVIGMALTVVSPLLVAPTGRNIQRANRIYLPVGYGCRWVRCS
jgi:hypothetical protein